MLRVIFIAVLTFPSVAIGAWAVEEGLDPLTDERIYVAKSAYRDGLHTRLAAVRCVDSTFDIYFDFDVYLDDDYVGIRYRVDEGELMSEQWHPSAAGTAVFASDPQTLAREMSHGMRIIVEATDYRGVQHRSAFSLAGSASAISSVREACGVASTPSDPSSSPKPKSPEESVANTGMWAVQVGSTANKANAEKLAANLRRHGYAAFLSQLDTDSGTLYRIRIGPHKDRAAAEAMAARLKEVDIKGQAVPHP